MCASAAIRRPQAGPVPLRIRLGSVLPLILLLGLSAGSRAQPPRPQEHGGARELGANEAAAVLDLPQDFLDRLEVGGLGLESSSGPKTRLTPEGIAAFAGQFSPLGEGLYKYQVEPGEYFALMSYGELQRQPVAGGEGAPPPGPALPRPAADRVDHRPGQSPVKHQGRRATCVAFAACAQLEAMIRRERPGMAADLSENLAYYWFMKEEGSTPCKNLQLPAHRAAGYLQRHVVADERLWPYVGDDPVQLRDDRECGRVDSPPGGVAGAPGVGVTAYTVLPLGDEVRPDGSMDIRDTRTLERLLADGHDIVLGTTFAWQTADARGIIDVKLGEEGKPIVSDLGHAMLIVGYDRAGGTPGGKAHFIVKNSYGTGYGHDGYLYLTYDYIRAYARYGYVTTSLRRGMVERPAAAAPRRRGPS